MNPAAMPPARRPRSEGSGGNAALLRHLLNRAGQVPAGRVARQVVFIAALLIAWISLKPFQSLSDLDLANIVTGQEGLTYATFGILAATAFVLVFASHRRALLACLSPATLALAAWLCLSVVLSQDPVTSAKRLFLTAAVVVVTACLLLLPRSREELRNLLAAAALILLAACYTGLVLMPEYAIHQPRDYLEPALAGNWRGTFGHKNAAAAVMAMMLFLGVGVFRSGGRVSGAAIAIAAGVFLVGCEGKSAFALCLVVFAITASFGVVRAFPLRVLLTLGPVLLFNVLSVGTVVSDRISAMVAALPVDATFTGRTMIWRFAIEEIGKRPIAGYGFAAFWGGQTVREVSDDGNTWAGYAAHSHNGYVDTLLTLGGVGLVLTLLVFVLAPLQDHQRASADGGEATPLATMFLQIWLFGLLLSCMESFFYDRADPIWITFLFAVFGLRYLARFATR